jgi:branched-chain amino acid transport system permease protein
MAAKAVLGWAWPPLVLAGVVIAIVLAAGLLSPATQRVVTEALIKLSVVVGLYIFAGNSGVLSFGHIAFMGIGAYVASWLVIPPETKEVLLPGLPAFLASAHWSPTLGALAAGAVAALFALIVGWPLMRLNGIAASIGTFAVLAAVNAVLSNWTSMTGGNRSLYGLPPYADRFVALAWALAAMAAAWAHQQSRSGFRLRGSREDETAARAAGVDVKRDRLVAFVLGAFFVGVAGALYAHFLGVVVAREFYLKLTFITVAMLVIGGIGSLSGAVAGVVVVTVLSDVLRHVERGVDLGFLQVPSRPGLQEVGLAVLMLVILIFRPRGLTGGREIPVPRFLQPAWALAPGRIHERSI